MILGIGNIIGDLYDITNELREIANAIENGYRCGITNMGTSWRLDNTTESDEIDDIESLKQEENVQEVMEMFKDVSKKNASELDDYLRNLIDQEGNPKIKKILEETPNPSERYVEILADYLVLCMEKQEKKEKKLLTENRMTTVNKRETSYEGLVSQLENGEDGIYNLLGDNNKNVIFQPKITEMCYQYLIWMN